MRRGVMRVAEETRERRAERVDSLGAVVGEIFERCEPRATGCAVLLEARLDGPDTELRHGGERLRALLQGVVDRAVDRAANRDASVTLVARAHGGRAEFEVIAGPGVAGRTVVAVPLG